MPGLALASYNKGLKGDQGPVGATGAGAAGIWAPAENALVAGAFDPSQASISGTFSAGILYFVKVKVAATGVITNVHAMPRSPAGAGLANTFLGIYTVDATTATLLAQTNDISTPVQAATDVKAALSSPTASQAAGTTLLIAFLSGTSTTVPTLRVGNAGGGNHNLTTGSPLRFGTFGTGLTALPATFSLASTSGGANFPWFGLS